MTARVGSPPTEILDEAVRTIVRAVDPERIIFFGSGARGEMTPGSDLDLMVVKRGVHRRKTAMLLYGELRGLGLPKDIVVVHPEDLKQHRDNPYMVIYPAIREGKTLYAVADRSSDDHEPGWPIGHPRDWLARAKSNLSIATAVHTAEVLKEDLAYELQQSVEKAVKAVLVSRGVVFSYTIDIGALLRALEEAGHETPADAARVAGLTNYALESRYPGVVEPLGEEEFNTAVAIAKGVFEWVSKEVDQALGDRSRPSN